MFYFDGLSHKLGFALNVIAGLLAAGYRRYGDEAKLKDNAISHLHEIYVRMNSLTESDPAMIDQIHLACTQLEQGIVIIPIFHRLYFSPILKLVADIFQFVPIDKYDGTPILCL